MSAGGRLHAESAPGLQRAHAAAPPTVARTTNLDANRKSASGGEGVALCQGERCLCAGLPEQRRCNTLHSDLTQAPPALPPPPDTHTHCAPPSPFGVSRAAISCRWVGDSAGPPAQH